MSGQINSGPNLLSGYYLGAYNIGHYTATIRRDGQDYRFIQHFPLRKRDGRRMKSPQTTSEISCLMLCSFHLPSQSKIPLLPPRTMLEACTCAILIRCCWGPRFPWWKFVRHLAPNLQCTWECSLFWSTHSLPCRITSFNSQLASCRDWTSSTFL